MIARSVPAERPVLAGFAKVDITPPLDHIHAFGLGYWYQRSIRFTGVRDPLYARALVLGDRDCQVFVSVDAILDTYGFVPESQRQYHSGWAFVLMKCSSHARIRIRLP
jgi:hypothetical protein